MQGCSVLHIYIIIMTVLTKWMPIGLGKKNLEE